MRRPCFIAFLLGCILLATGSPARAAFGVVSDATYYTVDSGGGLVFKVLRSNGGLPSIKFNGTELNDTGTPSGIASGLGSTGTTVSATADANTVVVTVATDSTNGVAANLTHYYVVRNGEDTIYMATYGTNEPTVGEFRWITRLQGTVFPTVPVESNIRNNTGAIESSDVFGLADGTTRSKYYGNQRAMDLSIRGVTGTNCGVFMVYGNRESSSGGPFFRDIQNQSGTDSEVYNYMNSGHNQTEAVRVGVLQGPYALMFTTGATPAIPDMTFLSALGLTGYVDASGRGSVTITGAGGRDTTYAYIVGFANTTAQYWTTAAITDGSATCANMKPGAYTMTICKGELAVYSASVTVAAGAATNLGTITITADPSRTVPLWRVGNWDGTPLEFRNATNIPLMHPSDVRQTTWVTDTFTIGSSALTDFPACQWQGVNGSQAVSFNLTSAQVVAYTVRIGITAAYAGGRPKISVNSWNPSSNPSPSTQPDSRSLTIGTYRGNNTTYTTSVPASAFVAGVNTLNISDISGSGGSGYLSPGYAIDCIDIYPTNNPASLNVPDAPAGLSVQSTLNPRTVTLAWNAAAGAVSYEISRATSSGGPYSVVATGLTTLTWTDQNVPTSGTDFYFVSAVNGSGKGAPATASIDPDGPPRAAATLTWTGAQSPVWDAGTSNWSYSGGGTYFYYPADTVRFDDTSSVLNVTISGSLAPTSATVDSSQNYAFSGTGAISGAATLTKSGSGELTISTAQAFTGGTTINAGTLTLGNAAALGAGPITLAGGILGTGALAPANAIVVSADSRITGGSTGGLQGIKAVSGSGALTLEATVGSFDLEGSLDNFTGSVVLTGAGGFRFFGGSGSTSADFNLGTCSLTARSGTAFTLGSLTGAAGSSLANNSSNSTNVTFSVGANGRDTAFAGVIANGGSRLAALTKLGSGALTLSGVNTYTGATAVSGGALYVTGSLAATAVAVSSGATLGGTGTLAGSLTLASGARLALGFGSTTTRGVAVAGATTLNGAITVVPALLGGSLAPGTYTLLTYPGTLTGSPTFTWSDTIASGYVATFDTSTAGQIRITLLTPLEAWRQTNFGTVNATGNTANGADFDGDGISNLVEYALGTNPKVPSVSPVQSQIANDRLQLTFPRIADPALTYTVQGSGDLVGWTDLWKSTGSANVGGQVTVPDTATRSGFKQRFLRLQITTTSP